MASKVQTFFLSKRLLLCATRPNNVTIVKGQYRMQDYRSWNRSSRFLGRNQDKHEVDGGYESMWSHQVKVSFINTPRNLKHRTCSTTSPSIHNYSLSSVLGLLEWISILLVLEVLSLRPFFCNHKLERSRQSWRED